MSVQARLAAPDLRRVINLAEKFVPFILKQKRPINADVQEMIDRVSRCRLCVLHVSLATRRYTHLTASVSGKPIRVRQRLNRLRKRVGHESLIYLESFYWNAAR